MSSQRSNLNFVFKAFSIGTVVGFVAGILLAPQSGDKTRDELKVKFDAFREDEGTKAAIAKIKKVAKEAEKTLRKLEEELD